MAGDSFENDVVAATRVGIPAVWFNLKTAEERSGELHRTTHSLRVLIPLVNGPGRQHPGA